MTVRGWRAAGSLLVATSMLATLATGCSAKQTGPPSVTADARADPKTPKSISLTEAQGLVDAMTAASAGVKAYDGSTWREREQQVADGIVAVVDLAAVYQSSYAGYADVRIRETDTLKKSGQRASWFVGDFAQHNPVDTESSTRGLVALSIDGFDVSDGDFPAKGKAALMAREVLVDLLAPAMAASKEVVVLSDNSFKVTYSTRHIQPTFGIVAVPETTTTFRVRRDGDRWLIVGSPDLGSFHLEYADAIAKKQVSFGWPATKGKPSSAELKAEFGSTKDVLWVGVDDEDRWWVVAREVIKMRPITDDEVYVYAAVRDASGKWKKGQLGAPDGRLWSTKDFPIPIEVLAAVQASGTDVMQQ